MSKMTEYLSAAVGYDANGLPASSIQFTFGFAPFAIADTEDIAEMAEISAVCQTDAVVDMQIVDNVVLVTFDFSNETNTFAEFMNELDAYRAQKTHVTASLNNLMNELAVAERNEDESKIEDLKTQMRSLSVPFMMPTIMPVCHAGTVHVGFTDDPKFILLTSEQLGQQPYKVAMVFETKDVFCQDEIDTYTIDTEDEIEAQQEELWYLQEAKKAEEEEYRAQYGYNSDLYDESQPQDKRLKGVRIK